MYAPAPPEQRTSFFVTPFSMEGPWLEERLAYANPTSATYPTANLAIYTPIIVPKITSIARWFWLNGATVGTDYVEVGLYRESPTGAGPGSLLAAGPRTLQAGTANFCQFANPGIHGTNVTSGSDDTDATVYTTASVTLKAGVLYLISVTNSAASAAAISSIDSATGGFPTFTSRSTTQFNGTANRVSIWSCVPTEDWTGTLRINFGATQTAAVWGVSAYYGVDTTTNDGIVQNAVGTGTSVTPLATLAAFGSANNATVGAFGCAPSSTITASAGYVKFHGVSSSSPAQSNGAVFRSDNDTTVDCTITSNPWGACAVEIKSRGTGPIVIPEDKYWLAFHCSGTTATFFRISVTLTIARFAIGYSQAALTAGLPAAATAAQNSQGVVPIFGFTTIASP